MAPDSNINVATCASLSALLRYLKISILTPLPWPFLRINFEAENPNFPVHVALAKVVPYTFGSVSFDINSQPRSQSFTILKTPHRHC